MAGLFKARFVALSAVALAVVITGCSAPAAPAPAPAATGGSQAAQPQPQPQPDTAKKVKRGGTFTRFVDFSFAGADPAMGQNAYQLWPWIGTYMIRREPDTWKLVGDAVEKWEFSPDALTLTLHVRKGLPWENKPPVNGREIEAKDIVYTLRSITGLQYPELPPLRFPRRSNLEDMQDAVAVDKYTVKVTMKQPSSTFIDGMAEYRGPVTPDGIREAFGGRDALVNPTPERYFTAGPFVLTKYQDSIESVYSRYPNYWEKGEDGQTKPYLDTVREIFIKDPGTQNAAFMAGQLDTLSVASPETRNLMVANVKGMQVITHASSGCWDRIAWNMTRKPFDDVRVRRSLALVLDPVETGKTMFGDWEGKPIWKYPGPLGWPYPESISQEELAKMVWFESPKSQKTIDEARKLMADAGLSGGFEFEMMSSTGRLADEAQLAISQINRVFPNIKMKAAPVDNAIQLERAAKRDFDAQYYCYIHEPTAVAMLKTAYHSKGGRNTAALSDPKMDDLLDRAGRELDESKRNALLREAQVRVFELQSITPTTHYAAQTAFHHYVRGFRLGGGTSGLLMFGKEMWLDK